MQPNALTALLLVLTANAAASGKGEFDTRRAFDALMAKQGRKCIEAKDTGYLAWGESYVMTALVTMYHATGDTAYLDRLVDHADAVLAQRDSATGAKDYRGRSVPGWTAGGHYSIGEIRLLDVKGVPTLYLRCAMTGYNNATKVTVARGSTAGSFALHVVNEKYKREERFEGLTMAPSSSDYAVTRIHASKLAQPFSFMRLYAEDLKSPTEGDARNPVPIATRMQASRFLWPVHQGMILEPMLLFARTVREHKGLRSDERYRSRAAAYIAAAEGLFRIIDEGWRENAEGEGWYEVEKDAPVWMDGCDEPHNHSLAVGAAMVQLAAATRSPLWHSRAEKMARTLKNDLRHVSDGDLYVWPYWWSKGKAFNGWEPKDGVSRNTPGKKPVQSMEDFAHGSIEINFAYRCFRDGIVFTRQDLERLANTFERNIVRRREDGSLTFADRVDGKGKAGRYDRLGPSWPLLAEFRPGILETFREMRAESPWNGYAVWMLQSANMSLMRKRVAAAGNGHDDH